MNKEEIFEILAQGEASDISELAAQLRETVLHTIIKQPTQELVMFQVEESVEKLDFNMGEILVTSAEVRVNDVIGYGMVLDADETKALDCALIMGVYEAGLPQAGEIEELAIRLHSKIEDAHRIEQEIIGSTCVNFEVMGGQDPNVKHDREKETEK